MKKLVTRCRGVLFLFGNMIIYLFFNILAHAQIHYQVVRVVYCDT